LKELAAGYYWAAGCLLIMPNRRHRHGAAAITENQCENTLADKHFELIRSPDVIWELDRICHGWPRKKYFIVGFDNNRYPQWETRFTGDRGLLQPKRDFDDFAQRSGGIGNLLKADVMLSFQTLLTTMGDNRTYCDSCKHLLSARPLDFVQFKTDVGGVAKNCHSNVIRSAQARLLKQHCIVIGYLFQNYLELLK